MWQPFGCYLLEDIMGFPDRIERTVELAHPLGKVWAALTTAEGLGAWFGNEAPIDLRPRGSARIRWAVVEPPPSRVDRRDGPTLPASTCPTSTPPHPTP